jgi:hypothetical protein
MLIDLQWSRKLVNKLRGTLQGPGNDNQQDAYNDSAARLHQVLWLQDGF